MIFGCCIAATCAFYLNSKKKKPILTDPQKADMNILIPDSWLREHLKTKATPKQIQEYLSLSGPSVEQIYDRDGEPVYDIEVTTNRVDSMSIRGIAREAAVILQQFDQPASLVELDIPKPPEPKKELPLPQIVHNPKLCQRVMCVLLTDVKRAATPDWMAQKLEQIEINVHDAVIDITNYITHELGHPCHAFDYDTLMALGGEIHIVEAAASKPFMTLDGLEYETVGGEVVFQNPAGEIIDLPGIKGTANSAITDDTTNVLLWIESCVPHKIRFGSMTHAIRTVAAQLNEKQVDPYLAEPTLRRGIQLYQEICDATVSSQIYDYFPKPPKLAPVKISLAQIETYLGLALPEKQITDILTQLGCEVKSSKKILTVQPPTFRPDLNIPADIIEDIARIYGYHRLPSVLMPTAIPLNKPTDTNFAIENRIKRFLAALGWQELYTYSMVNAEVAEASGYQLEEHLKIQNPLTDDRVYLRRSLAPSLSEIILTQPESGQLSVFEIANVYHPQDQQLPQENLHLTLVSNQPYTKVKGEVEAMLANLYVTELTTELATTTRPGIIQSAILKTEKQTFGQIHQLENGLIAIDFELADLLKVIQPHPTYQPIPKTAPVYEDLTFTLPEKTTLGPVIETLKASSNLVTQVDIKDHYQQNITFTITYHDPATNLTTKELEPVRKKLVKEVAAAHQATLVGQV